MSCKIKFTHVLFMIRCSFHFDFCILNAFASILCALCKAVGHWVSWVIPEICKGSFASALSVPGWGPRGVQIHHVRKETFVSP